MSPRAAAWLLLGAAGALLGVAGAGFSSRSAPDRPAVRLRVPINRAPAHALQRLPGIGPALSERIVGSRRQEGRFSEPAGLQRVRGIGPRTLERVRPWIRVDEAGAASASASSGGGHAAGS
jgi:competence ComEA-like helix-hairpin-helix protein